MLAETRAAEINKGNFGVCEIHQTQRYWPLTGWSAGEYETSDGRLFYAPPDAELLPEGWQWMNDWSVDVKSCPRQCDKEGWSYAASLDKLVEAMERGLAKGEKSTLSIVRRRRFTRSRIAISYSTQESIYTHMEMLGSMSGALRLAITERQREFAAFKNHEKVRSLHCRSGYYRINNQIYAFMAILKDYCDRLIKLSVFLSEIGEIETDYAARMKNVANALRFQRSKKENKERRRQVSRPQQMLESFIALPFSASSSSSARKNKDKVVRQQIPPPIEEYFSMQVLTKTYSRLSAHFSITDFPPDASNFFFCIRTITPGGIRRV